MTDPSGSNSLVEQIKVQVEEGERLKKELETLTANQQVLRRSAEEAILKDEELQASATAMLEGVEDLLTACDEDPRISVVLEDKLEELLTTVKDHAKNYLEQQGSAEAKTNKQAQEKAKEAFDKAREFYKALELVCTNMNLDLSGVNVFPERQRGGRPAGSGSGGSGKNGKGLKTFNYHYTRDGKKEAYDNLSRALWYSSQKSEGSNSGGRLTTAEFKRLLDAAYPDIQGNDFSKSWEVKLPNGIMLGFVREPIEASQEGETAEGA